MLPPFLARSGDSAKLPVMKALLIAIGCLSVLLGVAGIFLPLLPTVPFLLLASACFARSSDRLHRWLLHHPWFGSYLRDFEQGKGMPLKAKVYSTVLLWASLIFSVFKVRHPALQVMLAAIGVAVSIYLWRFVPTYSLPPRRD